MIDLLERSVEVANWLDLTSSVQHDRTAQNNPLPCRFTRFLRCLSWHLTRGAHVIHHGVDAKRSPHHKNVTCELQFCATSTTGGVNSVRFSRVCFPKLVHSLHPHYAYPDPRSTRYPLQLSFSYPPLASS